MFSMSKKQSQNLTKVYASEAGKVIQGPVVLSIVSLTSLLRGQLIRCFTTLQPNTLQFFVEKIREAFAMQKLLKFFNKKYRGIFKILMFEILTKC